MMLQPCGAEGSRGGDSGSKYGAIPAKCCRGSKVYVLAVWKAKDKATALTIEGAITNGIHEVQ